jgi:putative ABC transport system substrate-binding protein
MDRRTFIGTLTGGLLVAPLAAEAQPAGKVYRIGFLANVPQPVYEGVREGMRDLGWVEGRNFVMEPRYARFDPSAMRTLAAELVALPVDVIVAATNVAAFPAKQATKDIPIVAVAAHDAVGSGLVASLSRPGGNVTGLDSLAPGLDAKRLELLTQLLPTIGRVAVLYNPVDPAMQLHLDWINSAAETLRLKILIFEVRQPTELERVFRALAQEHPDALLTLTENLTYSHREAICAFATQQRLPGVFEFKEFAFAGGLLSYGPDLHEMYRRAANYVDKILRGAKPADLPIEQPTKFELAINLKTAKTLGITIPQSLLVRADEVIQ